jgi:hypothetical protein
VVEIEHLVEGLAMMVVVRVSAWNLSERKKKIKIEQHIEN